MTPINRNTALAACFALALTSCSGPRAPLNPPQLVTDAETDMSLQLFMQATIALSKYYGYNTIRYSEIADRSARAGFNTIPFMAPVSTRATPMLTSFAVDEAGTAAFRAGIQSSIGYKGLVAYYIKTGLRASQIVCRNYLLGLEEKNQYLEFLKREFGVAYSLANGILLAVSANGTLLHAFALSRDAVEGAVNAYDDYRFLNIDREAARALTETAQAKYAAYFIDQLNKSDTLKPKVPDGTIPEFFTFADALNAISTIEYQCTRSGIKSLLTRAINNTPTNLDVDRQSGTIMFKSAQNTVGTSQTVQQGQVVNQQTAPEQPAVDNTPKPRGTGEVQAPAVDPAGGKSGS